jgi:hypothetical protein
MALTDGTHTPIRVELVAGTSGDAADSRIPRAIAAAALVPGAVAAFFAADDGERSVYDDPAVLRAGDSGQTSTGTAAPSPDIDPPGFFDPGDAAGDGD